MDIRSLSISNEAWLSMPMIPVRALKNLKAGSFMIFQQNMTVLSYRQVNRGSSSQLNSDFWQREPQLWLLVL